ncbi:tRNA pseudouridine synthase-like protein [Lepidopterella palustris CBS 459.81]|uniref:tRNA pseudouridine synthase 1 n=1 Tax=Lepidopterella palustris CBS 459.81 TaxID=1314670 RepID=A0A8E2JI75_9PEZI|nr:tRNA pseudouridine synthase-like protein [Lepidopterella palustris CBS 459.81]
MDAKTAEGTAPEGVRSKLRGEESSDQQQEQSERSGGNDKRDRDTSEPPDKRRKWERGGRLQHGSRGRGDKKKNLGRREHFREKLDRRGRNDAEQSKRRKIDEGGDKVNSVLPAAFSKEEIDSDERKPKRKVAVLLGYSGTGYKGMQIDTKERTIEGDLFTAFVAAGAISKANADDPKKSSLVRCARTDKGVHAAGNVISLKLIIEDPDIVEKINSHLSSQIRVWGIERTTGSFSCYQACDSRWYEYLIPTHSFLPPHPSSFLGKKMVELAEQNGELEELNKRQEEVANFWPEVEEKYIKPILETLDDSIRPLVEKALYEVDGIRAAFCDTMSEAAGGKGPSNGINGSHSLEPPQGNQTISDSSNGQPILDATAEIPDEVKSKEEAEVKDILPNIEGTDHVIVKVEAEDGITPLPDTTANKQALEAAIKTLKKAYLEAKKAYRISPARKARVQEALDQYVGTRSFHNYTVQKKFKDPSAKRHIKSFKVAETPIMINGTEWLSLKVHGQSFMMHQIRKMVSMAALVVRCGCPMSRITESFDNVVVRIPKAPGLGLLLERPIFESYNTRQADVHGREQINFDKHRAKIDDFKQKEIYERIFREEEEGNQEIQGNHGNHFNSFFTHVDNYKEPTFLYLTSGGIAATQEPGHSSKGKGKQQDKWNEMESEDEAGGDEEG